MAMSHSLCLWKGEKKHKEHFYRQTDVDVDGQWCTSSREELYSAKKMGDSSTSAMKWLRSQWDCNDIQQEGENPFSVLVLNGSLLLLLWCGWMDVVISQSTEREREWEERTPQGIKEWKCLRIMHAWECCYMFLLAKSWRWGQWWANS